MGWNDRNASHNGVEERGFDLTIAANAKDLERLAPEVTCPVSFLLQWDDELIPRQSCLDLFDALGTRKKTLHANPGRHQAVPQFELAASVDYLDRSLR